MVAGLRNLFSVALLADQCVCVCVYTFLIFAALTSSKGLIVTVGCDDNWSVQIALDTCRIVSFTAELVMVPSNKTCFTGSCNERRCECKYEW